MLRLRGQREASSQHRMSCPMFVLATTLGLLLSFRKDVVDGFRCACGMPDVEVGKPLRYFGSDRPPILRPLQFLALAHVPAMRFRGAAA